MDPDRNTTGASRLNPKIKVAITYLVISLMLSCLSLLLAEAGVLFYPQLNPGAIVLFGFVLSWESLLSYRKTHSGEPFGPNLIVYTLAEWVILLIALKALLYISIDQGNLIRDLALWQKDFILTFITGDYLLAIGFTGLVWGIAHAFAAPLMAMESDLTALMLEKTGYFRNDREELKRGLIRLIFGVGGIMLILTALVSADVLHLGRAPVSPAAATAVLLFYFCLVFLLLAQIQYQILEARWFIQDVPTSSNISTNWIPTVLLLLAGMTLIACILPTGYSIGLLALLRALLSFLIVIPVYLELLCIAPFVGLMAALLRALGLMKADQAGTAPPVAPVFPPTAATGVTASIPLLELLKSAFFWTVFVLVIVLALHYYITQNREVIQALKTNRISLWLFKMWQWIFVRTREIKHATSSFFDQSISWIKGRLKAPRSIEEPFLSISAKLPPRQRILLLYLAMIAWNERSGIHRRKTDTPYEYAGYLTGLIPDQKTEIHIFTSAFMEARYTRHPLITHQAIDAQAAWEKIQAAVRKLATE